MQQEIKIVMSVKESFIHFVSNTTYGLQALIAAVSAEDTPSDFSL